MAVKKGIKLIKPAIQFKDEVERCLREMAFDLRYKYYFPCPYNSEPTISASNWDYFDFVSVIQEGESHKVIGYIKYSIDRIIHSVDGMSIVCFEAENAIYRAQFGLDLLRSLKDLRDKYKFKKLKFSVVIGSPMEPYYDRMVERRGGRIVGYYKDEVRLMDNSICDMKLYEVMLQGAIDGNFY